MFKKRSIKGTLRSTSKSEVLEEENDVDLEEEALRKAAVMEMKLEQSMRKKKHGTEYSSENNGAVIIKDGKKLKSSVTQSIESTLGQQFESRIDEGLPSSTSAHEKIMEQYIKQQMGIQEISNNVPVSKHQSQEDALYKLPDEYKYISKYNPTGGTEGRTNTQDDVQFMSIGIAEVTLPIAFKQINIEETDESRRKIEEERTAKYDDRVSRGEKMLTSGSASIPAIGTARFWNPQNQNEKSQASENKNTESDKKTADGTNKPKRSNDDHAVNRFKANERNRR